jgi:microcompartment protein CcmK/EutM
MEEAVPGPIESKSLAGVEPLDDATGRCAARRVCVISPGPVPAVPFARTPGRGRKRGEPRSVPAPPIGQARPASPRLRTTVSNPRRTDRRTGCTAMPIARVTGRVASTPSSEKVVPRRVMILRVSTLDGSLEGGVKCSCSSLGAVLGDERKVAGKRRRYVSLDGKGVDLGGCWSAGSSPGMIAREH